MCKISKKSKVISLVLAVCVLLSSVFSVTVFSAEVDYNLSTAYVDEFSYEAGTSYDQEVYDYIKQEMLNCSEYIYLTQFKISAEDVTQVFLDVIFDNPELFNVSSSDFRYGYDGTGKYIAIIAPNYLYTESEYKVKKALFQNAVDDFLKDIDPAWDDEMKALMVHDKLILNCKYSSNEAIENEVASIYTAYGALVDGDAVCQGYTLAYDYLLNKLGVEVTAVVSNEMNHSWSMVKIDGEYYHVDVTWDDPVPDRLGQVYHQYFLLSDEEMLSDTSHFKHYNWEADYVADSTKYDTYFWQSINTAIFYINECYYHIHNISGHENFGCIVEYDHGNCNVIYDIHERWYANEDQGLLWSDDFSYLAYDNNRFYFDTPKAVYSVNIYGEDLRLVYELTEEQLALGILYGIQIKDGKIYASMSTSPNVNSTNIYLTDLPNEEEPTTQPTVPTTEVPTTVPTEPTTAVPTTEPTEPTTAVPTTEPTEPTTADTREIGDIDNDTLISIKDATTIQSIVVKLTKITSDEFKYADVNSDGNVTINDATIIQMRCAKMAIV